VPARPSEFHANIPAVLERQYSEHPDKRRKDGGPPASARFGTELIEREVHGT
jgi:hypothetical protein